MPLELQWAVDERIDGLEELLSRVCEACFAPPAPPGKIRRACGGCTTLLWAGATWEIA